MLVVCNGAAKSGSTWLYNIVQNIRPFEWPEARYISQSNSKHPTIKETRLGEFLAQADYADRDVISKNHYGKQSHRDQLLGSECTRILDMSRDTRDVIVSSYYDECRRNGFTGTFAQYYWQNGRLQVDKLRRYHEVWSVDHPQILITSYESLKADFAAEVRRIGAFLDVELGVDDIERIHNATNLDSLRENYKDDPQYNTSENPFFRKGQVGDWQNHFDARISADYEKISSQGMGRFDPIYIRNRVRQKLGSLFS